MQHNYVCMRLNVNMQDKCVDMIHVHNLGRTGT